MCKEKKKLERSEKMINHLVVFKFGPSTTEEQLNEVINRLKELKGKIPGIKDINAGRNFSEKNKGFGVGLSVILTDQSALKTYGPHPEHQKVISYLNEVGLEDLIVIDL